MSTCYVAVKVPTDKHCANALRESFSFMPLTKMIGVIEEHFTFRMFDCSTKEELEKRMTILGEASGVDFNYAYKFL